MKKNITLVLNAVVIIIMMCVSIFISGTYTSAEEKIIIAKINTSDKYHYVICKEENFTRSEYSDSDLQTLTEKEINESCENTI